MPTVASPPPRVHCEPSPEIADDYRPTFVESYRPAPWPEAFWSGFTIGLSGECAASLHGTASERRAFEAGWVAGNREFEKYMAEWLADLEREAAEASDPFGGLHPCEAVEAIGVIVSREIGGAA